MPDRERALEAADELLEAIDAFARLGIPIDHKKFGKAVMNMEGGFVFPTIDEFNEVGQRLQAARVAYREARGRR